MVKLGRRSATLSREQQRIVVIGIVTTYRTEKFGIWVSIGVAVHRTGVFTKCDCTGSWTKEEEEELTKIVTEMTVDQGKDIDNDIFWGVVSKRMGGKRGRQQCRIKW